MHFEAKVRTQNFQEINKIAPPPESNFSRISTISLPNKPDSRFIKGLTGRTAAEALELGFAAWRRASPGCDGSRKSAKADHENER